MELCYAVPLYSIEAHASCTVDSSLQNLIGNHWHIFCTKGCMHGSFTDAFGTSVARDDSTRRNIQQSAGDGRIIIRERLQHFQLNLYKKKEYCQVICVKLCCKLKFKSELHTNGKERTHTLGLRFVASV